MKKSAIVLSVILFAAALLQFPATPFAGDDPGNDLILLRRGTINTGAEAQSLSLFGTGQDVSAAEGNGFYLVQFDGRIDAAWVEDLKSMGVKFFSYIPNNAYVVKMKPGQVDVALSRPHVKYVGPYESPLKIDPDLDKLVPVNAGISMPGPALMSGSYPTVQLRVKVFDGEKLAPVKEAIEGLGGKAEVTSDGRGLNSKYLWAEVPADRLGDVASIPAVEWVEKATGRVFNNADACDIIDADVVQTIPNFPLNGKKQILAVLDTGLDTGNMDTLHMDFAGLAANGARKIKGVISYRNDHNWSDIDGHGTHVAGSIVGLTGVAPGAQLYCQTDQTYRVVGAYPSLNDIVFHDAAKAGAFIHSDSWATADPETGGAEKLKYSSTCTDIDTFTWENKYFLPVFAAGNEAVDAKGNGFASYSGFDVTKPDGVVDLGSVTSPGTAKNALTVGAAEGTNGGGDTYGEDGAYKVYEDGVFKTYSSFPVAPIAGDFPADSEYGLAAFSGRGPTADGRIKPDVVAPGTRILSTRSQGMLPFAFDTYTTMSGTSMATPIAAGSAALVRQFLQQMCGKKKPTAALIKAALINGAYYLPGQYGNDSFVRPDLHQGFGEVWVENSVYPNLVSPTRYVSFIEEKRGVATYTGKSYQFYIEDPWEPVRVTLVWSDYPSSPAASKNLVNDLDLTVYSPSGYVSLGNRPDPDFMTVKDWYNAPWDSSGLYDHTNNVESLEFYPISSGPMIVNVQGYNVPLLRQPYALVVSGGLGGFNPDPLSDGFFRIDGTVVSASTKQPYPGATVTLNGPIVAVTAADGSGNFAFTGLIPGVYYVTAEGASGETNVKPVRKKIKKRNAYAKVTIQ